MIYTTLNKLIIKLKFLLIAVVLSGAGIFGYDTYSDATMSEMDKMMLENVEALTIDETFIYKDYVEYHPICGDCNEEYQSCMPAVEDGCSCTLTVHQC